MESIFGRWPSFHDAEILRLSLDRADEEGPTLDVVVHVFEMTKEIDGKGFYVLKNHTEVTFRFTHVVLRRLQWFNHQNVRASLEVEELDPSVHEGRRFRVEMPSSYGMEAEFECRRAIVLNVQPFPPAA